MIKAVFFLEDKAQEDFITQLVERIASEEGVDIEKEIFSSTGGSKVKKQLKVFFDDIKKRGYFDFDLLVISIDGNCKGNIEKENEIKKTVPEKIRAKIEEKIVYCIPNPHIERWYLLDLHALTSAVGVQLQVSQPPEKCQRDYYKEILSTALKPVDSLLGGSEYAEKLVENLDFDILNERDAGFERFVEQTRGKIRLISHQG